MNHRLRRLSPEEQRFLRYLKPGALAQLRDSKISARSHRPTDSSHFHFQIQIPPPSSSSQIDGYPCFLLPARINGPRFPQRKRLAAARPPASFSPTLSPADSVVDLFGGSSNDMLVAH